MAQRVQPFSDLGRHVFENGIVTGIGPETSISAARNHSWHLEVPALWGASWLFPTVSGDTLESSRVSKAGGAICYVLQRSE